MFYLCTLASRWKIPYQEKVIKAGFNAIGRSKCEVATVAMGKMATKSVMRQLYGMKGAQARTIMRMMKPNEKIMEYLNWRRIDVSLSPL